MYKFHPLSCGQLFLSREHRLLEFHDEYGPLLALVTHMMRCHRCGLRAQSQQGTTEKLTNSAPSSTPLTMPAMKAAQFSCPKSLGTEMYLFVIGSLSKM